MNNTNPVIFKQVNLSQIHALRVCVCVCARPT